MSKTIDHPKQPAFWTITLGPLGALALGALLLYVTGLGWQLVAESWLVELLWGLTLGALTVAGVLGLTRRPFARSLRAVCRELRPLFVDMRWIQLLVLALLAGVGEELLFRGFLQPWLAEYIAIEIAIGLAAAVFGLLHFASVQYFLLTTLLGLALGITYWITGSLLMVMVWHGFYDLLVFLILIYRPDLLGIAE
ncbi:MAG: CPBP family intramembrane glutamic endopeptidase [Fodinibius sp.]|nr:CPBP family intramembrane glutamic endopeptidase [Fodinibius sp.]